MVPINGSGLTRVALLNDFSRFGKCSLTVSIPIISSYGIETVPLPTAISTLASPCSSASVRATAFSSA